MILIPIITSHKPGLCGNVGSVLKHRAGRALQCAAGALSAHDCGMEYMLVLGQVSTKLHFRHRLCISLSAVTNTIISYKVNRKFLTDVWLTTNK